MIKIKNWRQIGIGRTQSYEDTNRIWLGLIIIYELEQSIEHESIKAKSNKKLFEFLLALNIT